MSNLIHLNPEAGDWTWDGAAPPWDNKPSVSPVTFHKTLPDYGRTPLHSLPTVAEELGLGHVLLKDESNRFGLPSFKILGASWAVYRAVADLLGKPIEYMEPAGNAPYLFPPLQLLGSMGDSFGLRLVSATEGNWGRAVARMGKYLADLPVTIFVPRFMPETTRGRLRSEGAEVVVVEGNYDDAVAAAKEKAKALGDKGLLVMDVGYKGYEHIPEWVVEGYVTMLDESDKQVPEQTDGLSVTHAIVPVGVGSIAQAVTQHYKKLERSGDLAKVMTAEPDTASSLKSSLEAGEITTVRTEDSIMCGMNCGTVSTTAWSVLKAGVDASILVTDAEAHQAVLDLAELGIKAGPCGAATLAALRRTVSEEKDALRLDKSSVVVLFCTEGIREYDIPA